MRPVCPDPPTSVRAQPGPLDCRPCRPSSSPPTPTRTRSRRASLDSCKPPCTPARSRSSTSPPRASTRGSAPGTGTPTAAPGRSPADVVREQQRLDTADHVVLVFPVHWWSMPALMKGWIDRVFVNGWAFDIDPADGTRRNLGRLTVHLLPVAGDTAGTYERHGYEQALRTQIEHGIVDYCGAVRGVTAFVYESEQDDDAARRALVDDAVQRIARAVTGAAGVVGAAGVADGQSAE
ncbi:NAD(P)H-dependent oxidoreductase [Curtobacterium sp. MCSS17_015]|uniref:NAD(P)H-dependent oxidoreductase n=1 Tax=Curtobacterium sp. MCSS17_015 TaxID=2175666 RepID=UPI0032E7F867